MTTAPVVKLRSGKVTVLGGGSWGTALAKLLAEKGDETTLWSVELDVVDEITTRGTSERYLPGAVLPRNLTATHDIVKALDGATMVVFVVPSHATREVAKLSAPFLPAGAPIVSATKGIENESLMFMDEVLADELPRAARNMLAFFSGPSFAKELARKLPTVVVAASRDPEVATIVQNRFRTPYLRVYTSGDVAGVECGGALKNVIAIAAGAADGLGFGHNTRAALITRGLSEMARLAIARGGSALTLAGLSGMGDLVLTCTGELSRNRTVGFELGKGRALEDVLLGIGHVAEGVKTAKSAYELSLKMNVEMPIVREVYAVLYEGKSASSAVVDLMERELGHEFDPNVFAPAALGGA
ncbi:NAD(P)-dependent glycerol-3-phosphate dehydrogenase [bacterium]|nr:MAG: NAD(P)-dependent glycerol-3-phosphate dehydrogenase [bacterium]